MMIVERIEEAVAVAEMVTEDGKVIYKTIPLHRIRGAVRAGDVLIAAQADSFTVDAAATTLRRNQAIMRSRRLKTP
ncbi:MAG: DUF3006 domain-containing protein [Oscillospiraceae bacterium]|nr:DUF3006 domain-containing protein [Oscillospiraceae bacterium]